MSVQPVKKGGEASIPRICREHSYINMLCVRWIFHVVVACGLPFTRVYESTHFEPPRNHSDLEKPRKHEETDVFCSIPVTSQQSNPMIAAVMIGCTSAQTNAAIKMSPRLRGFRGVSCFNALPLLSANFCRERRSKAPSTRALEHTFRIREIEVRGGSFA